MIKNDNFEILSDEEIAMYKFKNCVHCAFYPCELIPELILLEKQSVGTEPPPEINCCMGRLNQVRCDAKYVSVGIGDGYKLTTRYNGKIEKDKHREVEDRGKRWEPEQPVTISAQTGTGKNHFMENDVLPYVRELNLRKRTNFKVLYLSNRIALRRQTEDRIRDGTNDRDFEEGEIFHSYKGFDCADVMSYQSVLHNADRLKRIQDDKEARNSRYLFVFGDEAHFFCADAMFNPDTERILAAIIDIFHNAVRVYATATPYEVLKYIDEHEAQYFSIRDIQRPCSGALYHFKRNYDYLDVKYYSHEDELMDIIAASEGKWLVFLDDKDKGKALKIKLETHIKAAVKSNTDKDADAKEIAFAVDAASKYNPKYQQLILDEKLPGTTKVLIATSVVDNGVNIRNVNNVVISDLSKVKCLQMVGRPRVEEGDRITLYIKRLDAEYVERRLKDLLEQQDAYHAYDLAYSRPDCIEYKRGNAELEFRTKYFHGNSRDHENATHWFGVDKDDPKKVYPNEIARSLADKLVSEYTAILDEMRKTDEGQPVTGQRFLERQLSWFGKKYDIANDITLADKSKGKNELYSFLEAYLAEGTVMFADEQKKFSAEFTSLYDKAFQREDKNKARVYGLSKINSLLDKQSAGYIVESRTDPETKKTCWVVVAASNVPSTEETGGDAHA